MRYPRRVVLRGMVLCAIGLGVPHGAVAEDNRNQVPPGLEPIEQVTTEIYSEPPGAEVKIGDRLLGITPLRLNQRKLKPGTYELTFRLAKHVTVTRKVTVVAGTGLRVPRADLVTWPTVRVFAKDASAAGAMLSVDGRSVGAIPITYDVEAGPHVLKVERENHAPWIETIEFKNGKHEDVGVTLVPQFGKLVIGTGTPNELSNVDVVVYEDGKEVSLGTVPTAEIPRRAGQHTIGFRPIGVDPFIKVVQVPVNGTAVLLAEPPTLEADYYNRPWTYQTVDVKAASADCLQRKAVDGCLVAAYAAFHPKGLRAPDLKTAEKLYTSGCEQKDPYSCFALGYIEKLRAPHTTLSVGHLRQACNVVGKIANACWTLHLRAQVVPDPRHNPGNWEKYVKEEKADGDTVEGDAGGVVMLATSPGDGTPVYLEGSLQFAFGGERVQFDLGFALLRFRVLDQRRESTAENDWRFYVGSGIDLGVKLRPSEKKPLWIRTALRMTAYLNARSSFSFVGTLGYRIKGNHYLEAGVLVDNLPLRYERVDVFDAMQTVEDYFWRPVMVVRWRYGKDM